MWGPDASVPWIRKDKCEHRARQQNNRPFYKFVKRKDDPGILEIIWWDLSVSGPNGVDLSHATHDVFYLPKAMFSNCDQ